MVCSRWLHLFNSASTPVLIHLLRQPDRWVQAKPQRKGGQWPFFQRRINAGTDTFIAVSRPVGAGETATKGRPMAVFSEAHQRRYRYIYCGIPTGGCRQNRNERAANGRPFFDNVAVSTADLITPHPSPKVTPSPQAPQGEDTGVQTKFCTDIAQSSGTRNAMVYSNVPNRATGKFSAALALREATTVSSVPSNRATAICVSVAASIRL